VEEILPFGDLALLYDTAAQLDFVDTIDRLVPRSSSTSAGKALLLLVMNHLVGRVALDDMADWYWRSALRYWVDDGPEEFTEERLLGVLDSVCKQEHDRMLDKTWFISDAFRRKAEKLWGPETKYAYHDRTQVTYNGECCYYAEFSHAHGESEDRRKIGVGMVVRRKDGFPVIYRTYRGNKVDVSTVKEVVGRLKAAGLKHLILVMDRGMASDDNLKEMVRAGYAVVVGVRAGEGVFGELLGSLMDDEIEREGNEFRTGDRVFCVVERIAEVNGTRRKFVVYQDPRVRGEDKAGFLKALGDREENLKELKEEMECYEPKRGKEEPDWKQKVRSILGRMERYYEWEVKKRTLEWKRKREEIATALSRVARCMLMSTDVKIPKEELVRAYLDKDEIEKVWRLGKGVLGLAGIKHWKRDRVVAYLLVWYLAYLLWVSVRRRLREKGIALTPEKALSHLRRVEVVRFRFRGRERFEAPKAAGIEEKLQTGFDLLRWKSVMVK
jgi:transposase